MANRVPAEVFAPGEFIEEELEARGWTQIELAEVMGRPARLISELVSGKRAITPETAKGLGAAFGTGPAYWMNLERDYQLSRAVHDDESVERRSKLYAKAPIKEMVNRRWIEPSTNIDVLEKRVKDFLQIADLDSEPWLAHAARKGGAYLEVTSDQWAWLFRVKQLAKAIRVSKYSQRDLIDALEKLEGMLLTPGEIRNVPGVLASCGVRFIVVEKLSHAEIDGACFWLDKHSPVIGMTIRKDRIDNFWFVLRHEIEHVLNGHGQDNEVLDNLDGENAGTGDSLPAEERIANTAASDFCTPSARLEKFLARKHPFYYERDVLEFAKTVNRHPGLVVGQMQFRLKNYTYLAKHLARIRSSVLSSGIFDGWGQVPSF
jgi:HTH-type transcriptional regulator/antitoxin HigA